VTFLDLTFKTPAENLACDEALLDLCEEEGVETLRLWESARHFVVVGYGNSVEREVLTSGCQARGIPILRRCSGGGTVVQGPGCLSYNLTLRINATFPLETVTRTNTFVMERNRAAMENLLGLKVSVQGHTDLAFAAPDGIWWKFSGNAQRRRRHSLVFHGTILYGFDLSILDALLRFPSAQPEYRAGRRHS
jgi:lipoate-protein ligase A